MILAQNSNQPLSQSFVFATGFSVVVVKAFRMFHFRFPFVRFLLLHVPLYWCVRTNFRFSSCIRERVLACLCICVKIIEITTKD